MMQQVGEVKHLSKGWKEGGGTEGDCGLVQGCYSLLEDWGGSAIRLSWGLVDMPIHSCWASGSPEGPVTTSWRIFGLGLQIRGGHYKKEMKDMGQQMGYRLTVA